MSQRMSVSFGGSQRFLRSEITWFPHRLEHLNYVETSRSTSLPTK